MPPLRQLLLRADIDVFDYAAMLYCRYATLLLLIVSLLPLIRFDYGAAMLMPFRYIRC